MQAGDKIISDEDLETLLDRSPAAYERETGWHSTKDENGDIIKVQKKTTKFEVYQAPVDETNDGLAAM